VLRLRVDPTSPSTVFAEGARRIIHGGSGSLLFRSDDGGSSWVSLPQSGDALALDPSRHGHALLLQGDTVKETLDGGDHWRELGSLPHLVPPFAYYNVPADIAIDPQQPDVVWVARGDGAWRSVDRGKTWTARSAGLGGRKLSTLVLDPDDGELLYAVGDEIDAGRFPR